MTHQTAATLAGVQSVREERQSSSQEVPARRVSMGGFWRLIEMVRESAKPGADEMTLASLRNTPRVLMVMQVMHRRHG